MVFCSLLICVRKSKRKLNHSKNDLLSFFLRIKYLYFTKRETIIQILYIIKFREGENQHDKIIKRYDMARS